MPEPRPAPEPLDLPMVPFAVGGMALFALVGIVLAILGEWHWVWICLAGVLWGTVGLLVMLRHDAHRRSRRGTTPVRPHPEPTRKAG